MAKQESKHKHKGWLLKFVGSIAYLYVVWQIWSNPPAWLASGINASLPALGLGIIVATAVLSSVAYFVATFGAGFLTEKDTDASKYMSMWVWKTGMWSSFSLFVLTLPGPFSWVVLIGFVLSLLGSAISMM